MRSGLVIALLLAAIAPAAADDFGGWRYVVPKGYTGTVNADGAVIQKITPPTFCLMLLYRARPMSQPLATEAAAEWKTYVEHNFKVSGVKHHGKGKTKSALEFHATSGIAEDGEGNKLSTILYAVSWQKSVGSVLLISGNAESLAGCRPDLTTFLDALFLAPASAQPVPTPAPVAPVAAEPAPAAAITGRWATDSSSPTYGSVKREYTFAADGTYRFYSEAWGGTYQAETYRLTTESGTYKAEGTKVTLSPAKVAGVMKKKGAATPFKVSSEKMTYVAQKTYFEGIKEWNLVLTPGSKTVRDGEFASNERFPKSYLYSDQYKPEWKYPPSP